MWLCSAPGAALLWAGLAAVIPSGFPSFWTTAGARSGALIEGGENAFQVGPESGQLLPGGGVQDLHVDRPVAVDDPVPQPYWLLPADLGEPRLDVVGDLAGGFAGHGEVPQQRVAALAVGVQLAGGDP